MKIVCPTCRATVPASDIDLAHGRALCRGCSEVIALPDFSRGVEAPGALVQLPAGDLVPPSPTGIARPAFRPTELRWREPDGGVVRGAGGALRYRAALAPNRLHALPLLGFAAVWDAFLVFWYSAALLASGGPAGIMLWFPLLHVGVGLAITFGALRALLNTTHVTVDRERFRVSEGPLPGARVDEPIDSILDVDVALRSHHLRDQQAGWAVRLLTGDGRAVELPLSIATSQQADFACARLRHALAEARSPRSYRD